MSTLYTVMRQDGENREYKLTLEDAARRILQDDGCEYDIRPTDGGGFDLWSRQEVANVKWHKTQWYSVEDDLTLAEIDIFKKVVNDSGAHDNWRGLIATEYKVSDEFYGITRDDGNIDIVHIDHGAPATRIDADIYPVASDLSTRHEHAAGIILTPEDADKLGLLIDP